MMEDPEAMPDDLTDDERDLWNDAKATLATNAFEEWVEDFLFFRGPDWTLGQIRQLLKDQP